MHRTKQLVKSTIILTSARFISQLTSFILLPIYTNRLTASEFGIVDLLSTIIMIGVPLYTLQIEMGVFRFYITEDTPDKKDRVVSSGLEILLINTIILVFFVWLIGKYKVDSEYLVYLWLMIVLEGMNALMLQLCRGRGDNYGYGMCSTSIIIVRSLLCVLLIGGLRYAINGYLYATLIAQCMGLFSLIVRSRIKSHVRLKCFDFLYVKQLLVYSVPLVFNQIASWIINFSDRIIIVSFMSLEANGIYSAASKLSNIINGVMAMFNLAWTESVIRNLDSEGSTEYIEKALDVFIRLLMLGICFILGILPFVFNYLIGSGFSDSYNHVPVLLLSTVCSGVAAFMGSLFVANGRTKEVAVSTLIAAIVNLIINVGLITSIGLYAASFSTLVAFFLLVCVRYYYVKTKNHIRIRMGRVAATAMLYLVTWYFYLQKNKFICGFVVCLSAAFIVRWLILLSKKTMDIEESDN